MKDFLQYKSNVVNYLIVGITLLLVPIILNWLLQTGTPNAFNVISDTNSGPAIWLAFWGSYLAAIGSFVMAWVSYQQNKKQRQLYSIEIKIKEAESRYNDLEKFVLEVEVVHAWSNIENLIKEKDKSIRAKQLSEWEVSLYNISNRIVRFMELFNDNLFKEYGNAVEAINQFCIDTLRDIDNGVIRLKYQSVKDEHVKFFKEIFRLDNDVLQNERADIKSLYEQLEVING